MLVFVLGHGEMQQETSGNWLCSQHWIIVPVDHSLGGLSAEILIPHLLSSASWLSSSIVVYWGNAISFDGKLL